MDIEAVQQRLQQLALQEHEQTPEEAQKRLEVLRQQQWLLFLLHSAKCRQPPGACGYGQTCEVVKQLWLHMLSCRDAYCTYPRHALPFWRMKNEGCREQPVISPAPPPA